MLARPLALDSFFLQIPAVEANVWQTKKKLTLVRPWWFSLLRAGHVYPVWEVLTPERRDVTPYYEAHGFGRFALG